MKSNASRFNLITLLALIATASYGIYSDNPSDKTSSSSPPSSFPKTITLHQALDSPVTDGQPRTYTEIMVPFISHVLYDDGRDYFFVGISAPGAEPWLRFWRSFQWPRFALVRVPREIYNKLESGTIVDVHGALTSCNSNDLDFLELKIDSFKLRGIIEYTRRNNYRNTYAYLDKNENFQLMRKVGKYKCNYPTPAK